MSSESPIPPPPSSSDPSQSRVNQLPPYSIDIPSPPPPIVKGPLTDSSSSDDSTRESLQHSSTSSASDSFPSPDPTTDPAVPDGVRIVLAESQLEDGKKWNEERIERRLRGDYERAGRALSELVNENLETPLRLNAIRIVGAKVTRPSFLSTLFAPYLPVVPSASYLPSSATPADVQPQTLRSLLATTRDLSALLSRFDIFTQVDASLESPESVRAEKEDVDIVLRVKEVPRFYLKTATDVGDGEGSATGTARIRNTFGGAESLEGNISFGTRTKSAFQLKLESPVNASPTTKAELSIYSAERDLNYYASCHESTRGISAKIKTTSILGYHEFGYDAILRKIGELAPTASISVREAAGQTVKSSISHVLVRDTRDDPFMASKGSYLRMKQEFAGLGGDADFIKLENETSISRSILNGVTLSLGLRSGILYPLGSSPSLFPDRMHLGGPTSVRMFRPNAMGPKDSGDFMGGDLHWSTGLSLLAPIPKRPDWPVKCHMFVNAGRLIRLDSNQAISASLNDLFSRPSITAGVGLMYRHSLVRVEVNVGVPIAMSAQEGAVKGLQFGLGMSFL